jgi:hypothetical protein
VPGPEASHSDWRGALRVRAGRRALNGGLDSESKEGSKMSPWKRLAARRKRKAHERYLAERARQHALERQEEAQDAGRTIAQELGGRERWIGRP